jgi:peptide-methionine (S)-S-oxide reductase
MIKQIAIFGAGCFWSQEALFKELKGVISVTPGYAGGFKVNPSYEEVGSGLTGHAETIKVEFDPSQITYRDLLEVFFFVHDPTTLNRQGNDVGTQYRSLILYQDEAQKKEAEEFIAKFKQDKAFKNPIVTEITKFDKFYPAENYHLDYYENNKVAPYCLLVIGPKLSKFRKKFKTLLK